METENTGQKGFRHLLEINSRMVIHRPNVEGVENIPKKPCVIAASHLSDIDVQTIAAEMTRHRKVGLASQQTNRADFVVGLAMKIAGSSNFFDVTNSINPETHTSTYRFKQVDFDRMAEAIKNEGRTMVVATHRPVYDFKLPDQPGLGPIWLAHLTGQNLVLPIALDIHSSTPVGISTESGVTLKDFALGKRSSATMKICQPIELSKIPRSDFENMIRLYDSEERKKMSLEDRQRAKKTKQILKKESILVMNAIAEQLPKEKRGKWPVNLASVTQ